MQANPPQAAPIDSMQASGLQHVLISLELAITFAEMASTSRAAGQSEAARRNVAQAEDAIAVARKGLASVTPEVRRVALSESIACAEARIPRSETIPA